MDKLKFIKVAVFVMTFSIVMLFCIAIGTIVQKTKVKNYTINLNQSEYSRIDNVVVQDNRLFIVSNEEKILIVNLDKHRQEGVIHLHQEENNGEEKR